MPGFQYSLFLFCFLSIYYLQEIEAIPEECFLISTTNSTPSSKPNKLQCTMLEASNSQESRIQELILNKNPGSNFTNLISGVEEIEISRPSWLDSIKLGRSFFSKFPKLKSLEFNTVRPSELILDVDSFQDTPESFKRLRIEMFRLGDDTLTAILSLKDRLTELELDGEVKSIGSRAFLDELPKFTKLKKFLLNMVEICWRGAGPSEFPMNFWRNSAKSLESITVVFCPKMHVLKRGTFSGLNRLVNLTWTNNQVRTIEAGTFDDLVKLENLNMGDNNFDWRNNGLPSGLFDNNRQLKMVNVAFYASSMLDRSNFTHLNDIDNFKLIT